jgi:hypothetical protein
MYILCPSPLLSSPSHFVALKLHADFRIWEWREISEMAHEEAGDYAIIMAMELEDTLGSRYPSFIIMHSHVTGGFWLVSMQKPTSIAACIQFTPDDLILSDLSAWFGRKHLPKHDETITLVDEVGAEIDALYLAAPMMGLAAGWRRFALEHGLIHGDCLLFELIEQTKLKVRF